MTTAEFIKAAKISLMDRFRHPNWEYTDALETKLHKAGFRSIPLPRQATIVQRVIKHVSGFDMAFFMRETPRELSRVDLVWGSDVRDHSSIAITFSSGFNDDNGPHIQGDTTFHHYMIGDPSATKLIALIGNPDPESSLRPGLALETPEPPTRTPEMDMFIDIHVTPAVRNLRKLQF